MKLLVLIASTLLSFYCFAEKQAEQQIVVLVPGFFNSFTPEYFSTEITKSFQKRGFKVYVATGLNPVGTVEDNGARLVKVFQKIEQLEEHPVKFNVVAHSAGGLYALYAADKANVNIKNLLTIATPYKGVEFIQKWLDNSLLFKALTDLARLEGLTQLTPQGINKLLDSMRLSPNTRIVAYAGEQKKDIDIWDARNLSLPFHVTSGSISESSDGIVGVSSALGIGRLKTTENKQANQLYNKSFRINLEHWEQVLSGYAFIFLGIRNPDFVANEQTRFYGGLADYLLTVQ